jgi:hypothetical protein
MIVSYRDKRTAVTFGSFPDSLAKLKYGWIG